jgi:hypothetical protein
MGPEEAGILAVLRLIATDRTFPESSDQTQSIEAEVVIDKSLVDMGADGFDCQELFHKDLPSGPFHIFGQQICVVRNTKVALVGDECRTRQQKTHCDALQNANTAMLQPHAKHVQFSDLKSVRDSTASLIKFLR